jgi:hypothetical protein
MSENHSLSLPHPRGKQPVVEFEPDGPVPVDTYAGRIDVDWDPNATVTSLGQLPFFIEYLKQAGMFDGWVAGCPIQYTSPNAPSKRDLLGTVLLSILSGHWCYAHITASRATKRCAQRRNDLSHVGGMREPGTYREFLDDIIKLARALDSPLSRQTSPVDRPS